MITKWKLRDVIPMRDWDSKCFVRIAGCRVLWESARWTRNNKVRVMRLDNKTCRVHMRYFEPDLFVELVEKHQHTQP